VEPRVARPHLANIDGGMIPTYGIISLTRLSTASLVMTAIRSASWWTPTASRTSCAAWARSPEAFAAPPAAAPIPASCLALL